MTTNPGYRAGPALAPSSLIYGAFALGLTTAIAFRIIIILQHFSPGWVRPVWYFAVVGNLVFFYYRYRIAEKRKRAVHEHGLIGKIEADTCFSPCPRSPRRPLPNIAFPNPPKNSGRRSGVSPAPPSCGWARPSSSSR